MKLDIESAFPKVDAPGFSKHASLEWHNLLKGKTKGLSTTAAELRRQLKPKRGRLNNFTILLVWLILCLERPWERPDFMKLTLNDLIEDGYTKCWEFSLTEKHGENIWNKIDAILDQILKDYPDQTQLRTIRNHLKKGELKSAVVLLAIDSKLDSELGEVFSRIKELAEWQAKQIRRLVRSDIFQAFKVFSYLKKQKPISKRDLMRKFGINKARCEYLLEYILSEDESYLKILDRYPNNSVWIVYTGP